MILPRIILRHARAMALIAAVIAALAGCGIAAAWADDRRPQPPVVLGPLGEREMDLLNRAQMSIIEFFASPSNVDDWGGERLGDNALEPGGRLHLLLGRSRVCSFDVAAVFESGAREEQRNVNLCRTRQIAFDGAKALLPPKPPDQPHSIAITNANRLVVQQLFLSAPDAPQWGDDRLADQALSVGETRTLAYQGSCLADLRIVFSNRAAEERRALNLCTQPSIRLEPGWTTSPREGEGD